MRKIFLAGPYGHADREVVDRRFNEANAVAARIAPAGTRMKV